MNRQDSRKLVLNLETLKRLQQTAEESAAAPPGGGTQPTPTATTLRTGCC